MNIANERYRLMLGDCLAVMKSLPDNSVDSIVTDPPYGLSFMGKKWDYDVPSVEIWVECLRVLKPGGHLLSFAGTRTQHRMAVNIEDAGFEIRDMVSFLYDTNETAQTLIESLSPEQLKLLDATFGRDGMLAWVYGSGMPKSKGLLKPAVEPITLARKPAPKSSPLNIQACLNSDRWPANLIHDGSDEVLAGFPETKSGGYPPEGGQRSQVSTYGKPTVRGEQKFTISNGSAARFFYCAKASRKDRHEGLQDPGPQFQYGATLRKVENTATTGNNHPTVKPTDLMAYLCRLVTPSGGVVLDPFMGSGSTGVAAMREGFQFIGIEREEQYLEIAKARIAAASNDTSPE